MAVPGAAPSTHSPPAFTRLGRTVSATDVDAAAGWSGASLTRLVRPSDGAAFVLKRTSWAVDWIARSTRDHALREGFIAATPLPLPEPLVAPYLGAAADGTAVAMLMPDLSDRLLGWELGEGAGGRGAASSGSSRRSPASTPPRGRSRPRPTQATSGRPRRWPSGCCSSRPDPLRDWRATASPPGSRFLEGWTAFDRRASSAAVELVRTSRRRPGTAPGRARRAARDGAPRRSQAQQCRAARGWPDRAHRLADDDARPGRGRARLAARRQFRGPARSAGGRPRRLSRSRRRARGRGHPGRRPIRRPRRAYPPDALAAVFGEDEPARFRPADAVLGDWALQVDLAWIVGLLLRGWRKGADAEAGAVIGSGVAATDDLGWWCDRAVEAAGRRL